MDDTEAFIYFAGFAVAFIFLGLKKLYYFFEMKRKSNVLVIGEITKIKVLGYGCYGRIDKIVTFSYNNKNYTRKIKECFRSLKVGDRVSVIFNPRKLEEREWVLIKEDHKLLISLIFIIVGFAFATITYVFLINN